MNRNHNDNANDGDHGDESWLYGIGNRIRLGLVNLLVIWIGLHCMPYGVYLLYIFFSWVGSDKFLLILHIFLALKSVKINWNPASFDNNFPWTW